MNPAEGLEDHETRVLHKLIQTSDDEEVVDDDRLAFVQLQAGALKVKVHVEMFQELCDGVLVRVRLLLDDLDQILQCIPATAVNDDGRGQVAQDVRAHGLDGVQVECLAQEHLDNEVTSLGVVEEHQHTPVDQPGALLQRLDGGEVGVVDVLAQPVQVVQSRAPVQREDLGGQLAPQHVQVVFVVGRHDQQTEVQVGDGVGVVAALVQVLGVLVDTVHHVGFELQWRRGRSCDSIHSSEPFFVTTYVNLLLQHTDQGL